MAGMREFMPGQVWFYYNAHATKDIERHNELGACTCRPVVIIQNAFYPEWNDIVTVLPMTSSDRRSGVYIDTTIFKDGSLLEGGTVLPYLFYNIKTKFLLPVLSSNHKRKLLSLSQEDFDQVKRGYLYHLGVSKEVPDYIEHWKHLSDYDRSIVIQSMYLAVDEFEDAVTEGSKKNHRRLPVHESQNPVIALSHQVGAENIENHLVADMAILDHETNQLKSVSMVDPQGSQIAAKIQHKVTIPFVTMKVDEFSNRLSEITNEIFPYQNCSRVTPGSDFLSGIELKKIPENLTKIEMTQLVFMQIADIKDATGIRSISTASRLRKDLRENYMGDRIFTDENSNVHLYQAEATAPFLYTQSTSAVNRPKCRRNAKRRHILFKYTKEELLKLATTPVEELYDIIPNLSGSQLNQFCVDALFLYPYDLKFSPSGTIIHRDKPTTEGLEETSVIPNMPAPIPTSDPVIPRNIYALWETLSPQEINEIASSNKRNIQNIVKNFGVRKENARNLRVEVLSLVGKNPTLHQMELDPSLVESSILTVIRSSYAKTNVMDLLYFCRTDPALIMKFFNCAKSANTPNKAEIRKMKTEIRKLIVIHKPSKI